MCGGVQTGSCGWVWKGVGVCVWKWSGWKGMWEGSCEGGRREAWGAACRGLCRGFIPLQLLSVALQLPSVPPQAAWYGPCRVAGKGSGESARTWGAWQGLASGGGLSSTACGTSVGLRGSVERPWAGQRGLSKSGGEGGGMG